MAIKGWMTEICDKWYIGLIDYLHLTIILQSSKYNVWNSQVTHFYIRDFKPGPWNPEGQQRDVCGSIEGGNAVYLLIK